MRLYEVENRFVSDLETLLRNLIGRGDSERTTQKLSYPALSNLLTNMGYGGINYDVLKSVYDENPGLQPLIANFNADHIVLGTKEQEPATQNQNLPQPGNPDVDKMAKSGAADYQQDLSK